MILTSLPPTLEALQPWLDVVEFAAEREVRFDAPDIIGKFMREEVGKAWAEGRRRSVIEEVRGMIIGGWSGWEGVEKEYAREVISVEEVEVEDEDESAISGSKIESSNTPSSAKEDIIMAEPQRSEVEEEGWGWDETPLAGPSSPRKVTTNTNGHSHSREKSVGDGWDFDAPNASIQANPVDAPPAAAKPAKPAREAKRLGKKVAKAKIVRDEEEDDPWGSNDVSEVESRRSSISLLDPPSPPAIANQIAGTIDQSTAEGRGDDWGWDDPQVPAQTSPASQWRSKPKRKILREVMNVAKERYTVSVACDKLLEIAKGVLQEAGQLINTPLVLLPLSIPHFQS